MSFQIWLMASTLQSKHCIFFFFPSSFHMNHNHPFVKSLEQSNLVEVTAKRCVPALYAPEVIEALGGRKNSAIFEDHTQLLNNMRMFYDERERKLHAAVFFPCHVQAYHGGAHGGAVSTAFDMLFSWQTLVAAGWGAAVTASGTTNFRALTPVERVLAAEVSVVPQQSSSSRSSRKIVLESRIYYPSSLPPHFTLPHNSTLLHAQPSRDQNVVHSPLYADAKAVMVYRNGGPALSWQQLCSLAGQNSTLSVDAFIRILKQRLAQKSQAREQAKL